jgi:hypothetical protein
MKTNRIAVPERAAPERGELKRLALTLAGYKTLFFLVVFSSLYLLRGIYSASNFSGNFHWPPDAQPSLETTLKTWDAQQFLYLAEQGYRPGGASNSFFPLWPALIRLGAALTGGRALLAALLLSNALSLAGFLLFYAYARRRAGAGAAEPALLLLLAFPGSLFFSFAYSESLFLALAMLLLVSLADRRFGRAAAASALLSVARPQGIMTAPAYWFALWRERKALGARRAATLAAAPLAGFAAYLAFMRWSTGSALDGLRSYAAVCGQGSPLKLLDPAGFWRAFINVSAGHDVSTSPVDRALFVAALALLPAVARLGAVELLFALPLVVVPAMALSFVGYTRHLALVAPVFLAAGVLLAGDRRRWGLLALCAVLQSLQTILAVMHVNNYWAG